MAVLSSSYAATASYVLNAISSSFASTASFATSIPASILNPYVLTSSTSSMSVLSSSFTSTASRLEGVFSLRGSATANANTISSLGGLAFNNNASIDQDAARSIIFKTTPDGNVGTLATRLTISGSGQIGINALPYVSSSLIVSGGVILNGTSTYFTPYSSWPVQLHSGQANNGIGIYSDVVGQYGYGSASPYYQFGYGGSATWRLATSTNQGFLIQNIQPSLNTRVYVSASGYVGIGTSTPLSNLHVHKDASGAPILGLEDGITLTLENDTTNYINFRSPNTVYAGLAFTTPADNSAGYIALRQSTGDMVFSTENANGYHTFQTADTERLRIANTETTVRNNLIVSGTTSQFTASGESLLVGKVHIGSPPPTTVTSPFTINAGTQFFDNVYIYTGKSIQGGTAYRALIYFGASGDSYINNGNFGVGTASPSCSLDVKGTARMSGSLTVTGSVTISNILTLTPQHPLPSVNLSIGSFAVSSSTPPKPYFWDGTNWYALY